MSSLFRQIKKGIRRLLSKKVVRVDGVLISTDPAHLDRQVRNGIFKETYEEPERILLRRALRPSDRVLEVGGGCGLVSLVAASICGAGNVLTYEANRRLEPVIRENFRLNGLSPNLRIKAITPDGSDATFHINDNIVSSSLYDRKKGERKETVPSDSLDGALQEWRANAIVMDAEGAEVEILGASPLNGVEKIIVELHPHIVGEEKIASLVRRLESLGFVTSSQIKNTALLLRAGLNASQSR